MEGGENWKQQEWNAIQDLRRQRFNCIPVLMLLFVGLQYTILLTPCIYFKNKMNQIFLIFFLQNPHVVYLPHLQSTGRPFVLHFFSWVDPPVHSFPPFKASCCMTLVETWLPPPQVCVQDPHVVHLPHLQSTGQPCVLHLGCFQFRIIHSVIWFTMNEWIISWITDSFWFPKQNLAVTQVTTFFR